MSRALEGYDANQGARFYNASKSAPTSTSLGAFALLLFFNNMKNYNLHYAVFVGDTRSFNAIIAKNPELILERDIIGYTPVHIAVEGGNVNFFRKMCARIDPIIDLGQEDLLSLSSLAISYKSYKVLKDMVELFKLKCPHLLNKVWREMACVEDMDEKMFMKLSLLIGVENINVNELNDEGDTVLTFNCGWGRVNRIKSLLKLGCDPNLCDKDNDSPLAWAAQSGSWEAVALLIKAGARYDAETRGLLGSPLHRAAYIGSSKIIDLLIAAGADPLEKDKDGLSLVQSAKSAKENFLELKASCKKIIIYRSAVEDMYHVYYHDDGYRIFVDGYDRIITKFQSLSD